MDSSADPGERLNTTARDEIESLVAAELADSPAVIEAAADAAEAAVTADIAGRDLIESDDNRIQQTSLVDDPLWAVVDIQGRKALAVKSDGSVRIYKLDFASLPDGSLTSAKLSAAVQSSLVAPGVGSMLATMPESSGYLWGIVDNTGRIALGVRTDGTVVGKIPVPDTVPALLPEVSGTSPTRKLWALDQATGVRTLITAANDPHDAVVHDGAILFTDANGRKAYDDGVTIPAWPDRTVFAAWGDSLTASTGWPSTLDGLITANVANLGQAGNTADEIAVRQGAYVLNVTITGGSIPTSGAVTVTTAQGYNFRTDNAWSQLGTLAGVPGTLSRAIADPANTLTFTRTSSGSAVPVVGTTPFTSADAITHESHPVVLFAGRNDAVLDPISRTTVDRVLAAYEAMVARLRAYHKEFLIVGTITGQDDTAGTSRYLTVVSINNELAARYGDRYYDLRHYLVTQCIYDMGITPTAPDLANIAADTLPPSIMADPGHFSTAAGAKVAIVLKTKLDQLGWTL